MKKILLFTAVAFSMVNFGRAQTILSETFDSYTTGDFGTDVTGVTPGQGGWFTAGDAESTTVASLATNSNFQITNNGAPHNNVLTVSGVTGNTVNDYSFAYKNISSNWSSITSGNNTVQLEFDLYTGSASTASANARFYIIIFDSEDNVIGGYIYYPRTRVLRGGVYATSDGTVANTGFYSIKVGANSTDATLTANTWYRLGFSADLSTGEVKWKSTDANFDGYVDAYTSGVFGSLVSGATPKEFDMYTFSPASSTVAFSGVVDNLLIKATPSTDSLLGVDDVNSPNASLTSIYPNPVKDAFQVKLSDKFEGSNVVTTITDLSGKTVKQFAVSADSYNVSDLTSGVYLVTFDNGKTKETKKLIKK